MRPLPFALSLSLSIAVCVLGLRAAPAVEPEDRPRIQVALLLDDSGSMQGLISQARATLWDLINQLSATTRGGRYPQVQVALYHYGDRPFLERPLIPLTNDLDAVSQQLFAINGGGGSECCGEVIRNAVTQLAWSQRPGDLKLIVIAGNEAFTQGDVDWRSACLSAAARGIRVNTIHCGPRSQGVEGMWAEGARLAEGTFAYIDHNAVRPSIAAPQDEELRRLNEALNGTYLSYGVKGEEYRTRQVAQDVLAERAGAGIMGSRSGAKAGKSYRNESWDLVDAQAQGLVDVKSVPKEQLPAALRELSPDERVKVVAEQQARRTVIQQRIVAVVKERDAFVASEEARLAATTTEPTLREALRQSLREQAAKLGYTVATPDAH